MNVIFTIRHLVLISVSNITLSYPAASVSTFLFVNVYDQITYIMPLTNYTCSVKNNTDPFLLKL